MKRRRLKKKPIIIFLLLLVLLLLIIIYNLVFSNKSKLIGTWTTDNNTIYIFNTNNKGILKVSLSEYSFKYKIKKNILYIDFDNDKSNDSEYVYKVENKKLILTNDNGEFIFNKKALN